MSEKDEDYHGESETPANFPGRSTPDSDHSEHFYRELIENIGEVFFSLDNSNRIIYINHTIETSYGYQAGRLAGSDFSGLICPDHRAQWMEASGSLEAGITDSIRLEICVAHRSGEMSWARISAKSRLIDGNYSGMIGLIRDITLQRSAEEALKESEERHRAVWENSPIGISLTDPDGVYHYVNPAYCAMYGFSQDELIGNTFFEMISKDPERRSAREKYRELFAAGKAIPLGETAFRKKDGDAVLVEYTGDFVIKQGKPFYLVSMNVDITEKKRTEKALRVSEYNYKILLDNSIDAIILVDESGKLLLLNAAAAAIFNSDSSSFGGKTLWDIFPEDEANDRYRLILRAIRGNTYLTRESPTVIDGETRWFQSQLNPVTDPERGIKAVQITARDITDEKRQKFRSMARMKFLYDIRITADIDECLQFVCDAVYESESFKRSVFSLVRDYKHAARIENEINSELMSLEIANTVNRLPRSELLVDRFRIGQSYFVPADQNPRTSQPQNELSGSRDSNDRLERWQNGDVLFVPAKGEDNAYFGWLSVDMPFDDRRPAAEVVDFLEEIVNIAAQHIREIHFRERLAEERKEIERKNVALNEVLESIEEEKIDLKRRISSDLDKAVFPLLEKLSNPDGSISEVQLKLLRKTVEGLSEAHGGSGRRMSRLTSRELEICDLIKAGETNNDIASQLKIRVATVKKHRESIRNKLGLKHKDVNLTTYLISL